MGYYLDLKSLSPDDFKNRIVNGYLPPGRKILREDIDKRFGFFEQLEINDLDGLLKFLKSKNRVTELSNQDLFTEKYLKVLIREINSLHPTPNKLKEFTGIEKSYIEKIESHGFKNTQQLYDHVLTSHKRLMLSKKTGIPLEIILELTRLTDLSRIKWTGPTFATMLLEAGIHSVKEAAMAVPETLHRELNQINKEKKIFRGSIGLNDVRIFIQAASDLPMEIEDSE